MTDSLPLLTYIGRNRSGASVSGQVRDIPCNLAGKRYRGGWKWMEIRSDGRLVGGIGHDGKRRIWWGESE